MAQHYKISDHYDGKRFYNLDRIKDSKSRFSQFLKWQLTRNKIKWPSFIDDNVFPKLPQQNISANDIYITFINHSTFLIQGHHLNVLSDPIFSERASPLSWIGPKRVRAPGLTIEQLPKIDVVVISHNHYDHLDLPSLAKLSQRTNVQFIVPLGNAKFLMKIGIKNIIELDWWQKCQIKRQQTITLVPAKHWSQRVLHDNCKALWGSFVIDIGGIKIFYAGDTGFSQHFNLIQKRLSDMDICLLPIGAYRPRWFMKTKHINPEEAVMAHHALGSKLSIAGHFNTFQLGDEGIEDPILDLKQALKKHHLSSNQFIIPANGLTIHWQKQND